MHGCVASSQPAVPAAFTQPVQGDGVADAVLVPIHNQGATGKQVPVHRLQSTDGAAGWFSLQVILHQACHMLGNSQRCGHSRRPDAAHGDPVSGDKKEEGKV